MINPFFNANLYLAKNPDLAAAGLTTPDQLWAHYSAYGAQESLSVANRAPNSWFDASFYLTNNPDLGAAGVTAGMALDHYYQYGVHEGRLFNPDANLAPSNFNAKTYAQQNPDLVAAFGIVNANNPSVAEGRDLQLHFLAYGYKEGRPGVTPSFANEVEAANKINLDTAFGSNTVAYGTAADDAFISTANNLANKTVNGLGGNDSITFGTGSGTGSGASAVKIQNIEQAIIAKGGNTAFQSNQLLDIQINTTSNVHAAFDAAAVVGQSDELTVVSNAVNTTFTTNGIENLNFNLASTSTTITATANQAKGDTLTVDFNNGSASGVTATVDSAGSTALTNLIIDGSDLTGALNLNALGAAVNAVQHVTVYGSDANVAQNFTTVANSVAGTAASGATFTVEGGAGVDTFAASKAIDSFAGGAGNDIFNMGAAANTKVKADGSLISGVDTIQDFSYGDKVAGITGASIVTGTGAIPSGATLEQLVTGTAGTLADGDVFSLGADTYVLVNQDATLANVSLVKLAGVDVADLQITGGNTVEFI